MILLPRTVLLQVLPLVCLLAAASAAPPPRSFSTSRQFIVYGTDAQLRGALCDLAERTKSTALRTLQEQDRWQVPIVVHAQLPQANLPSLPRAQLSFSQTGFGLKIQLDLGIDADVSRPEVERELLRAILLEMIYRAAPDTPAGAAYVEPPDWLLDGTLALADGANFPALAEALATPVASGNILPLEEFLRQRPELLDTPSRALHRAYAAALVAALLDAPDGASRLARYVSDLPHASRDTLAELQQHFPGFGATPELMQKQWTLSVARLATTERYRLLSCAETERELVRLLRVELREGDQPVTAYMLEEFPKFAKLPAAPTALRNLSEQLLLLSGRANPLYQPVLLEYQEIAALIARGRTKRLTARLAEVRGLREQITRRMGAIADYLNWYEATQAREMSGSFRGYLQAAEAAQENPSRRRDAISIYLDALEAQF